MALGQSYDYPSTIEVTPKDMENNGIGATPQRNKANLCVVIFKYGKAKALVLILYCMIIVYYQLLFQHWQY